MRILFLITILYLSHSIAYAQDDSIDEADYRRSSQLMDEGWKYVSAEGFESSLEYFNKSIELYDGNADAYIGRATALMKLDKLLEAENDVKSALNLVENQSDMFYLAGNIYFKMEFYEDAIKYYSMALEYNETSEVPIDSINCYYNRGNCYFKAGMYRSAINEFSKSIAMDAEFYNAYHNRGLAYKNREDLENACLDFYKAKEFGSNISDKFIEEYCK